MAIVQNHAITATVNRTLDYCAADKIGVAKSPEQMENISYVPFDTDKEDGLVIYETLTTSLNLTKPGEPYNTFKSNMKEFGAKELANGNAKRKDGLPVLAWHYIQSFEGGVDPQIAHEIGVKLAEKVFPGFAVQVSTHTDKENIHNHFVICAWDNEGKKWNQSNKVYQNIRSESDRLCDEYGLSVLEGTREQKLVEWTDRDGKKHKYEPTDRKNRIIENRERGEAYSDDVGSYRNTKPYEREKEKIDTLTLTIRRDIDRYLPFAKDYEHLLSMLREQGYTIKDKKKNGEWLSHVVFLPPGAEEGSRGKRDYLLHRGSDKEEGYYTRENLEKVIAQTVAERGIVHDDIGHEVMPVSSPVIMGDYDYSEIDVMHLDTNFRTERQDDGSLRVYQRGEVERDIIHDVKEKDAYLHRGLIDTSDLDRAIREQALIRRTGKNVPAKNKQERLIREIQQDFDMLSFVERRKVYTYRQANEIISGLWNRHNETVLLLDRAKKSVSVYRQLLEFPSRLQAVQASMKMNAGKPEYMALQYHKDLQSVKTLEAMLVKYGINTEDGISEMQRKADNAEAMIEKLSSQLNAFRQDLTAYQECMKVLRRIDGSRGNQRDIYFREYDAIFAADTEAEERDRQRAEKDDREPERKKSKKAERE